MNRPRQVLITIQWLNEDGEWQAAEFDETNLEEAETLIGLMDGNITEEDLKP